MFCTGYSFKEASSFFGTPNCSKIQPKRLMTAPTLYSNPYLTSVVWLILGRVSSRISIATGRPPKTSGRATRSSTVCSGSVMATWCQLLTQIFWWPKKWRGWMWISSTSTPKACQTVPTAWAVAFSLAHFRGDNLTGDGYLNHLRDLCRETVIGKGSPVTDDGRLD